jgi:hypothetical protein
MSNVIHFRPGYSPSRMASGDGGAQILFFTGVRYQRWSEEAHAPQPQAQGPGESAFRLAKPAGSGRASAESRQ